MADVVNCRGAERGNSGHGRLAISEKGGYLVAASRPAARAENLCHLAEQHRCLGARG